MQAHMPSLTAGDGCAKASEASEAAIGGCTPKPTESTCDQG
jgi:hypothetical protein